MRVEAEGRVLTHDRWGVDQAEEYLRELQRAIERAAANPRIGRACDEIRRGYRKLAAGSHTLFYRVSTEGVTDVVRPAKAWTSTATSECIESRSPADHRPKRSRAHFLKLTATGVT